MLPNSLVALAVGIALLLFGRKLFWLFVAAAGFIAGMQFASSVFTEQPPWLFLLIAVVAGLIGALLGVFLQRIAAGIAGFLIGGYIGVELMRAFAGGTAWTSPAYLVGGILGAVCILLLFDWALIVLSSFGGSMIVVRSLSLEPSTTALVFLALLIAGIVIQAGMMRTGRPAV